MTARPVPVPVYAADRKTLLGTVHRSATSVGAAKVAGTRSAQWANVGHRWAWVAVP